MNVVMQILPWVGYGILAVIVIAFFRWILSLRRVVRPSEVHVVRKASKTLIYGDAGAIERLAEENAEKAEPVKKEEVAGNAYYAIPSWIPIWGVEVQVLPLSNFSVDLDNYEAYDKDKLPFKVDVTAFFRIADYRQAASRIADNKTLQEHLKKIVQSAVRTILASDALEDIMVKRSVYGEQFTKEVRENLKAWGVVPVKSVELMDIRDKDREVVVENIMKKKKSAIDKESRIEVAKNQQAAKQAELESEQNIAMREQEKEEEVGKRTAEKDKAVGIAKERSQQQINDEAKTTKEKEMAVKQVETIKQAEIDKEKQIVEANAKKDASIIDAEALVTVAEKGKNAATHNAEAEFIKTTKEAEANLVVAQKEAEGTQAKGEANAKAEELLGLAKVKPQIELAEKIGENKGYQEYLIEIQRIEALRVVGTEQAQNLSHSQIKIVANAGGNIAGSVSKVMDLFTPQGGQALAGMLETFAGTEQGQALLAKLGLAAPAATTDAPATKTAPAETETAPKEE